MHIFEAKVILQNFHQGVFEVAAGGMHGVVQLFVTNPFYLGPGRTYDAPRLVDHDEAPILVVLEDLHRSRCDRRFMPMHDVPREQMNLAHLNSSANAG